MYYRVAIQVEAAPPWKWQSTALSSLGSVLQWLQFYRAFPHERLRIFSSSSREALNEQLEQENQGLASTSVTTAQFLQERMILSPAAVRSTSACEGGTSLERGATAVISQQVVNERGTGGGAPESRAISSLERRREALESGPGGDHDLPYNFSLPLSLPPVLAWTTLLVRIHRGELQP